MYVYMHVKNTECLYIPGNGIRKRMQYISPQLARYGLYLRSYVDLSIDCVTRVLNPPLV